MDAKLVKLMTMLGAGGNNTTGKTEDDILDDVERKLGQIEKLLTGSVQRGSTQRLGSKASKLSTSSDNSQLLLPPSADDLSSRGRELKKVQTRDRDDANNGSLISALATLYNKNGGDAAKIAKECGADIGLMRKYPPKSANDFAEKLLFGIYTKMGTDITVKVGPPSAAQLQEASKQLKKTVTAVKDMAPAENELQAIGGIFQRCGGDMEKIAAATGCCLALLNKTPPKDGLDFAAKLLLGVYTDAFAVGNTARPVGERAVLSVADLQSRAGALKKVDLMTSGAISLEADLKNLQSVYETHKGNLETLANVCGVSFAILKKSPPKDSLDFAEKVLEGAYTDSKSEEMRSKFGGYLMLDALLKQSNKLKSVSTNLSRDLKPSSEEISTIAKLYTENGGDLANLAKATGAELTLLEKNKPKDATDFAEKLMAWVYVGDKADIAKKALRDRLSEDLLSKAKGLKNVPTQDRSSSGVTAGEMSVVKKMFDDAKGDWDKLAASCGANAEVLKKKPPANADEFAKKMFEGCYVAEASAVAWEALRKKLGEQLVSQKGALKKSEMKEGTSGPSSADVDIIAKIYESNHGDLTQIAAICGLEDGMLKKNPPANAKDFATKLLGCIYIR